MSRDINSSSIIVCATRGGAGSRAVQQRAIDYARERAWDLIFLYIVDTSRMSEADEQLKPAVNSELYWIGRTLLGIAQKRAANARIKSEIIIREGQVRDEICRFLEERSANLLLLGAPRGTTAVQLGDDFIEQFAQTIQENSGVPVEIVRPESD